MTEAARSQKVGHALLSEAERQARERGLPLVRAGVRPLAQGRPPLLPELRPGRRGALLRDSPSYDARLAVQATHASCSPLAAALHRAAGRGDPRVWPRSCPREGRARRTQDKIQTLYIITGVLGLIVLVGVEAVLIYLARQVPPPPRRARAGRGPRQRAARDRLDGRRDRAGGDRLRRDVRLPAGRSTTRRARGAGRPAVRGRRPLRRRRPGPRRPAASRCASTSTASSTSGATTTSARSRSTEAARSTRTRDMYVPINTTVTLKIYSSDVDPLLVDPEARRQGRRDAGPHQRDLVQDLEARHLQGPVRRAVRRQPRRHARARDRAAGRPVPDLGREPARGTSSPPRRRSRRSARPASA